MSSRVNTSSKTTPVAQRRQRASSKQDIARVFAETVAAKGYSDASIAEVARALGLSKGTIVHHFGTKAALLEHVHVRYMERRLAEIYHVLGSITMPEAQLSAMIYAVLACHRDDRAATVAFLREFVRFASDPQMNTVRVQREGYTALFEGIVRRGIDMGRFHTDDPALVTLQIFGMCNYAWTWFRPDGPKDVESIATTFIRIVLRGLTPPSSTGPTNSDLDAMITNGIATVLASPGRLP